MVQPPCFLWKLAQDDADWPDQSLIEKSRNEHWFFI